MSSPFSYGDPGKRQRPRYFDFGADPYGWAGNQSRWTDASMRGDPFENRRHKGRTKKMPPGTTAGINPQKAVRPSKVSGLPVEIYPEWQWPDKSPRVHGNREGLIWLDAKSERRARMFRRAIKRQEIRLPDIDYSNEAEVDKAIGKREEAISRNLSAHRTAEQMHTDWRNPRVRLLINAKRRRDDARAAAAETRSTKFDPDRGKNTIPYRPAVGAKSRPPTPPRPSSGRAPRIAGMAASSILRGTGALGAIPSIIHLTRGNSLGSLVGPLPDEFRKGPKRTEVW